MDEIYTTVTPDYRQTLRKRYGEKISEIRKADQRIQEQQRRIDGVSTQLSKVTDLGKRTPLLVKKVQLTKELNRLMKERDGISDDII